MSPHSSEARSPESGCQDDGAPARVGVGAPIHGGHHLLLLGRAERLHLPLRQAARMEVREAIGLQVPVAPEPGGEAARRPAVLVNRVRAQPARRSPQGGGFWGRFCRYGW